MVPDYESGKFRGSAQGRTAAVSFLWWPYAYLRNTSEATAFACSTQLLCSGVLVQALLQTTSQGKVGEFRQIAASKKAR